MTDFSDKREIQFANYSFRGLGPHLDLSSAIRADISRQHFTVSPRHWYADATLECRRCRAEFCFAAAEQQAWYEEYAFWIECVPCRCAACRKELRRLKALKQEYDRNIAKAIHCQDSELKVRIAAVVDQLFLSGAKLPLKIVTSRNILAKQIARLANRDHLSFQLSKHEAALRAVKFAEECLAALPTNGWQWECCDAIPDPMNRDCGRKVPRKWTVAVRWSQDGTLFDGPGIVMVDVENGTAQLVEGP